ncbi:MAG: hypothetical protein ACKVOI_00510 [Dongiaceae bacterium]
MSLWPQFWKRKKIETPQQLADFIALEADVLTQRTILNYTQALLGRQWKKLIETAEFRAAMHRSRWESYPAILGDFVCIAEAQLRPHAEMDIPGRTAVFQRLFETALAARPIPHEHAGDCEAAIDRFPSELGRRLMADPKSSHRIAVSGGSYLFDHLPIHESARETHKLPVVNAVRFAMVAFRDNLERRIADPAALMRQIAARPSGPG